MSKFICRVCSEEKDIEERHKGTPVSKIGVSRCKKCHAYYVRERQLFLRATKMPQNYYSCSNCEQIFFYNKNQCPSCNSKNFEDYIN